MFEGKSIFDILQMGGWALWVLLSASILSFTVIIFKLIEFWNKSKVNRADFVTKIMKRLKKRDMDGAIEICDNTNSPMAPVAKAGIKAHVDKIANISEAMEREIMIETLKLERFNTILGTIGSVAVYIGLFGTVIGIIRAFHDISGAGSGGISIVIGGVSEALIATAAGLFVAIPAIVAYNLFTKRVDDFVINMEYCASEVEDIISGKSNDEEK